MMEIKGKYNTAIIFSDNVDEKAAEQIKFLCGHEFVKGSRIRIMPDIHVGAGCTIGTTMTIRDKVVPNLVGVDIGCGMHVSILGRIGITAEMLKKIDRIIRKEIPCGFEVRRTPHGYINRADLDDLRCAEAVDIKRATLSIGTLGGGNHFIELGRDDNGIIYLVVHTGSRHLGKQTAEHYQHRASAENPDIDRSIAYVSGRSFEEYLNDMRIAQDFAGHNREAIAEIITREMGFHAVDSFVTIHNYIDIEEMMLRKGAVSAKKGELLIIPVNMKEGSIIAVGKGNPEWNCSAPHGAGRVMSRKQAKKMLSFDEFRKSMEGIYSTSISRETIDEAPLAYKPLQEILTNIRDTVDIQCIIKPVYNFKASGD